MLAARTTARAVNAHGRRTLATVVDAPVKIAAADKGSATASVTFVVKAGSRYETSPGAAHVLKNFAFKGTAKRSALATVREAELYGGVLSATLGREHLALTADFLRGDEEYFVDVLSSVLTSTNFASHELHEVVAPQVESESHVASSDSAVTAIEIAHSLAFRNGLGNPLLAKAPVEISAVKAFASQAFTKENVAVIASGISESTIAQLIQSKLSSLPSGSKAAPTSTKYFGGSSRVSSHGEPTLFIGFGTTSLSPALSVLAAHLEPTPSLKWTEGTSPFAKVAPGVTVQIINETYSDGVLFGALIQGKSESEAAGVTEAGKIAVQAFKSAADGLKGDELTRAVARSKFAAASAFEGEREVSAVKTAYELFTGSAHAMDATLKGLDGVKVADISKVAMALTGSSPTYVAVGNLESLPYADELGL